MRIHGFVTVNTMFLLAVILCDAADITKFAKNRARVASSILSGTIALLCIPGIDNADAFQNQAASSVYFSSSFNLANEGSSIRNDRILRRLQTGDSSSFHPGITNEDFYFPSWFQGDWRTHSVFTTIETPIGVDAMGGQPVYDRTVKDLNTALDYVVRFDASNNAAFKGSEPLSSGSTFDRSFNVKQMAQITMGSGSFLRFGDGGAGSSGSGRDATRDGATAAQSLTVFLDPAAATSSSSSSRSSSNPIPIYRVTLDCVDRLDEIFPSASPTTSTGTATSSTGTDTGTAYATLERTRQTITPLQRPISGGESIKDQLSLLPSLPAVGPVLQKEIETITIYTPVDNNQVTAKQRTATYLSPLDPRYSLAVAREPAVAREAIDVRTYDLSMQRIP
mmetsp:Transcript_1304/g.2112  ORF Transcript_1304/g.2112 Transcript_1304/m.2112 type:complete len:393 (+) Transcript_1304:56-1234(+)